MLHQDCARLDPRIRRTRQLLHDALRKLLEEKEFDKISIQDITEAATLNRATFYAHYPDKFALLEESISVSFLQLLQQRNVKFDGTCPSAFKAIILAVCDYLLEGQSSLSSQQHQFEPFLQATVIDEVRLILLDGFRRHSADDPAEKSVPADRPISPEAIAATASWAIYGAAKQWVNDPNRLPQEDFVELAVKLVQPILMAGTEPVRVS
jgi:AcrR family transcriptional regulator